MTNMVEQMDVDSSFDDNDDDKVDTHHLSIFKSNENLSTNPTLFVSENRYENKSGAFTTGIDIFSKDEQQKMVERAKRFGLSSEANLSVGVQEDDLYASMGIDEDSENSKHVRFNALHMRGTENMSTKDVFDYFGIYAPTSIEWINDISCNIVWEDRISAARALLGSSKKIVDFSDRKERNLHKNDGYNSEEENRSLGENSFDNSEAKNDTIDLELINFPVPPGIWRKGVDCSKSKTILLRFALNSDKKQHNSEKLSDYYKKYGNPNFGGMKGILTDSRKRMYKQTRSSRKRQGNETDVTNNMKRIKNPWGALSENWGANDAVEVDFNRQTTAVDNRYRTVEKGSIKERLGFKNSQKGTPVFESESEESSDSDEMSKKRKTLRMRMHADDEEEKVKKKRLNQLTNKILEKMSSNDLRSRLGKSKPQMHHDPIQVIIRNTRENFGNIHDNEDEVEEVAEGIAEEYSIEEEEKEEGEWGEDEIDNTKETIVERPINEEQDIDEQEDDEETSDSSSDISEKEVQGPRGSVIKVIPRVKPRVASTVWARLNHNSQSQNSSHFERKDLRETLKNDLRNRLGYQNRERSPLRIEVKNDKYAQNNSESE